MFPGMSMIYCSESKLKSLLYFVLLCFCLQIPTTINCSTSESPPKCSVNKVTCSNLSQQNPLSFLDEDLLYNVQDLGKRHISKKTFGPKNNPSSVPDKSKIVRDCVAVYFFLQLPGITLNDHIPNICLNTFVKSFHLLPKVSSMMPKVPKMLPKVCIRF